MNEGTGTSIILHETRERYAGVVRITPEAQDAVRALMDQSGLNAREIVSDIIVQAVAKGLVDVTREAGK